MMKEKIYIAGKVSGLPREEVVAKFKHAENYLKLIGYRVINPMRKIPANMEYNEAMKLCIGQMCTCDAVYLLPDWQQSPGAMVEHDIAVILKMQLIRAL